MPPPTDADVEPSQFPIKSLEPLNIPRERMIHRCLLIHELLARIVRILQPRDKLRLGQACRAFYDVAMDDLWRDPGRFGHKLIYCLPRDTIRFDPRDSTIHVWREPHTGEWDRFIHHARRAKVLSLVPHPWGVSNLSHYLDVLRDAFRGRPVLPNVREIHVAPDLVPGLDIFLHEGLSKFHLVRYTAEACEIVISLLKRTCSRHLESLQISKLGPERGLSLETTKEYEDLLYSCSNLRLLSTSVPLHPNALVGLAALPFLAHLHLYSPCMQAEEDFRSTLYDITFPSLLYLSLHSTGDDIIRGLSATSSSTLEALELGLDWVHPWGRPQQNAPPTTSTDDVSALFKLITKYSNLRKLHVFPPPNWPLADSFSANTLAPLRALNLVEVIIYRFNFDLQPDDIVAMAHAWPRIERLYLGAHGADILETEPHICIEDLLPFAQHCRLLSSLELIITGSSVLSRSPPPADALAAHRRFSTLSLGPVPIMYAGDRERIAGFVLAVFPNAIVQGDDELTQEALCALIESGKSKAHVDSEEAVGRALYTGVRT